MNEQERLQKIIDILAEEASNVVPSPYGLVTMTHIQRVAKEITAIFKQPHKDTRSKRERALDLEFERMGVKPRVYHFTKDICTFNAVTVALAKRWRKGVTEDIVKNCVKAAHDEMENKATFSIAILKQAGIYGVAICDKRDQFNKRTGRMKAKGRLLQHLLWEAQKK